MDGHGKIINSCFLLRCGRELLPVSEGNERNVNYSKVQYFFPIYILYVKQEHAFRGLRKHISFAPTLALQYF